MNSATIVRCLVFFYLPVCLADGSMESVRPPARVASSAALFDWSLGLLIVLAVFFLCVWGVRKLNGFTVGDNAQMRIIGGLSLGVREKIILVQVGKKQLVLGVTPGRIQTLHILENDDCLIKGQLTQTASGGFAEKLMQTLKGQSDV